MNGKLDAVLQQQNRQQAAIDALESRVAELEKLPIKGSGMFLGFKYAYLGVAALIGAFSNNFTQWFIHLFLK